MSRTSVVVVTYNHRGFLADCVSALDRAGVHPQKARLFVVDNGSTDGTPELARGLLAGGRTPGGLPAVFIDNGENLGFTGGNNIAIRRALAEGDEFVYLLNPDTEVEPGFLDEALAAARTDQRIALVQSLILRHPETDVVNTFGNVIHFLGFGYAAGDGQRVADVTDQLRDVHDIAYPSGAGMLARASALAQIGSLADELFLYHEDLELGWRARLAGLRVVLAPRSRVHHKYSFGKGTKKYFFLERNRALVLAWMYDTKTLALIAPALAAMEVGVWSFAIAGGWGREKLRAYGYFLQRGRLGRILEERRRVQGLRTVSDREVTALFTGEMIFPSVSPWLLTRVANPLLAAYWRAVKRLV